MQASVFAARALRPRPEVPGLEAWSKGESVSAFPEGATRAGGSQAADAAIADAPVTSANGLLLAIVANSVPSKYRPCRHGCRMVGAAAVPSGMALGGSGCNVPRIKTMLLIVS